MARFSEFKLLFASKENFNGSILYRSIKIWLFQKIGKIQNKVGVIGCKNDTFLSKIGQRHELKIKRQEKLKIFLEKSKLVGGLMGGCKSRFKNCFKDSNHKKVILN